MPERRTAEWASVRVWTGFFTGTGRNTPSENSSAAKTALKPKVSTPGTRTGKRWLSVPPAGTVSATRWTEIGSTPSQDEPGYV